MFSPKANKDALSSSLKEIVITLERQKQDIKISRTDSRIARTIEWLLAHQNRNGSWGHDNVAVTAMTIIALSELHKPSGTWSLQEQVDSALNNAELFLINRFKDNAYENAMWDTSVAVRALQRKNTEHREFLSNRINWLLSQPFNRINAGPHHFAQRTLAFLECGVASNHVIESAEQTAALLKGNRVSYSPYVLSQCLEAIQRVGIDYNAEPIISKLTDFLEHAQLDSANFINISTSLDALYPFASTEIENKLRLSVASLFGETCFRENGSWYSDELCTAYALIALTRFSKEVVIVAPKSELIFDFNKIVSSIESKAHEFANREFKISAIHIGSSFLAGSMLTGYAVYTTLATDMYEWIKWGLPTIGSVLAVNTIQYLVRYVRKNKVE